MLKHLERHQKKCHNSELLQGSAISASPAKIRFKFLADANTL
jgi:hypothetical protein